MIRFLKELYKVLIKRPYYFTKGSFFMFYNFIGHSFDTESFDDIDLGIFLEMSLFNDNYHFFYDPNKKAYHLDKVQELKEQGYMVSVEYINVDDPPNLVSSWQNITFINLYTQLLTRQITSGSYKPQLYRKIIVSW